MRSLLDLGTDLSTDYHSHYNLVQHIDPAKALHAAPRHTTTRRTAIMVSYVKNYIQDQAMGYLATGITAAGTMAGNAVGGVGGLIESGGRSIGQGTTGRFTPLHTLQLTRVDT